MGDWTFPTALLAVNAGEEIRRALEANLDYIRTETLATEVTWTEDEAGEHLQLKTVLRFGLRLKKADLKHF